MKVAMTSFTGRCLGHWEPLAQEIRKRGGAATTCCSRACQTQTMSGSLGCAQQQQRRADVDRHQRAFMLPPAPQPPPHTGQRKAKPIRDLPGSIDKCRMCGAPGRLSPTSVRPVIGLTRYRGGFQGTTNFCRIA
jgi:hypothetical protein